MTQLKQEQYIMDDTNTLVPTIEKYVSVNTRSTDEIAEIIKQHAVKNRIACGRLRRLAKELGLPGNQLGSIAKEHNIKIVACELGCF